MWPWFSLNKVYVYKPTLTRGMCTNLSQRVLSLTIILTSSHPKFINNQTRTLKKPSIPNSTSSFHPTQNHSQTQHTYHILPAFTNKLILASIKLPACGNIPPNTHTHTTIERVAKMWIFTQNPHALDSQCNTCDAGYLSVPSDCQNKDFQLAVNCLSCHF